MPSLDPASIRILLVIERWKQVASDEVDSIDVWRDVSPYELTEFWSGDRRCAPDHPAGAPPKMPKLFCGDTIALVAAISTYPPKLDTSPLMNVYNAVDWWHEDHDSRRVPPQSVLFQSFQESMMTLCILEQCIHGEPGKAEEADSHGQTSMTVNFVRDSTTPKTHIEAGSVSEPLDTERVSSPPLEMNKSVTLAVAAYEWAVSDDGIPNAKDMSVGDLFDALCEDRRYGPAALPPCAETFGKYLRTGGIKRYKRRSTARTTRSIIRLSEVEHPRQS